MRSHVLIPLLAVFGAVSGAASPADPAFAGHASGSPYFSLTAPRAYKARGGGLELAGRMCRRALTTVLSPGSVRLEHVAPDGSVRDVARAYARTIFRNPDEACSPYVARVAWTFGDGDQVRACFSRGAPCAADAPKKPLPANPPPAPAAVPPPPAAAPATSSR